MGTPLAIDALDQTPFDLAAKRRQITAGMQRECGNTSCLTIRTKADRGPAAVDEEDKPLGPCVVYSIDKPDPLLWGSTVTLIHTPC